MGDRSFLYFAYGSNMLACRLRDRCPSATPLGIAELCGHELRWHKLSKKDGSGKCDVVRSSDPQARVIGVLYKIDLAEKGALDKEEGGYKKIEVDLWFAGDLTKAQTYQAIKTAPALRPYTCYRELVVEGAKEHGLPADYIACLGKIPARDDPDCARHDKNMRLIAKAQA